MAREEHEQVERLRKKNDALFVTATAVQLGTAPVADLGSLDALVEIAKRFETVILEVRDDLGADFLLWDDGLAFRFRHGPRPPARGTKATRPPRPAPEGRVVIDKLRGSTATD